MFDLLSLGAGFVAGLVVAVVVPRLAAWVKGEVSKVESKL
jgi:hypothetical protein